MGTDDVLYAKGFSHVRIAREGGESFLAITPYSLYTPRVKATNDILGETDTINSRSLNNLL